MNAVQGVTFESSGILEASDPKYQDVFSQSMVDIGDFKKFTADFVRKIENGDILYDLPH